ncbi:MAG TPA: tryptophan synthase subunit alpha [Methanothermococcus okinawensis]|uniref:Tryptophan synthase alpha chain n=1 Tax=Methanothermococcus okinawensis TaxID=155863 RepID=A0A833E4S0_9EURY|nr:tryptophan synthase subunit alpha [Methanococcaceae archaeon]HIP84729.1 tryptophan synthase subunit alpha [Methanothermococcus okinawensis]HIP90859.1 tryptophan synthase subunit alpha [Methanothermococcus okinawensis]
MEKKLVSFIVAGDPNPGATLRFMRALTKYSDIIELGIPFSDPMADGETIQRANIRALKGGMKVSKVFDIIREFRAYSNTPVVVMTYYNPVYNMGVENFVRKLKEAGGDGLIVVDLPVEEAEDYLSICRSYNIGTVFLAAPNTPEDRLREIDRACSLFLYLVSLYGTTGVRDDISNLALNFLKRAKGICKNPIYVGFGVWKREHARKLIEGGADGVVVGSAYVKIIERYGDSEETLKKLEEKSKELKEGILEGCKK